MRSTRTLAGCSHAGAADHCRRGRCTYCCTRKLARLLYAAMDLRLVVRCRCREVASAGRRWGNVRNLSAMRDVPPRSPVAVLAVAFSVLLGVTACGDDGPSPGPSETPTAVVEDCVSYDPVRVERNYAAGVHAIWYTEGQELVRVYGGPSDPDGDAALRVAKGFSMICYIGRGNSNPDHVFEYWRGRTGASLPRPSEHSVVSYDPTLLRVENTAAFGWRVTTGLGVDLQHFATEEEANRGLAVMATATELCKVDSVVPSPDLRPAHITFHLE